MSVETTTETIVTEESR